MKETRKIEKIQNELNGVNKLLALTEAANKSSEETLRKYQQQFIADFQEVLNQIGLNYRTTIKVNDWYNEGQISVDLYFHHDERSYNDFTVELKYKENATYFQRVSAAGKSISGSDFTADNLNEYSSYYKMVFEVTEKLKDLEGITKLLSTYKKPEVEWISDNQLKTQKKQLENELKIAEMNIQVGQILEYYYTGTSRYDKSQWREVVVEKLTAKSVVVKSDYYGKNFTVKNEDIHWRLRSRQEEEGGK